jgi:hypothetical protein
MVWAAIGLNYKSPLLFVDENLNASGYIELLQTNQIFEGIQTAFKDTKVYFQQDRAPAHNAKKTKQFIKKQIDLNDDWPANSPDLSPIENLWGILKKRVQELHPKSLNELKLVLIEEWKFVAKIKEPKLITC